MLPPGAAPTMNSTLRTGFHACANAVTAAQHARATTQRLANETIAEQSFLSARVPLVEFIGSALSAG